MADVVDNFRGVRRLHLTLKVNILSSLALGNICVTPPLINMLRINETERLENARGRPVQPQIQAGHQFFTSRIAIQTFINRSERNVLWIGCIVPDEEDNVLFWLSIFIQSIGNPKLNRELV